MRILQTRGLSFCGQAEGRRAGVYGEMAGQPAEDPSRLFPPWLCVGIPQIVFKIIKNQNTDAWALDQSECQGQAQASVFFEALG